MIELLCRESKADAYVIAKVDNKGSAGRYTCRVVPEVYRQTGLSGRTRLLMHLLRALNEKGQRRETLLSGVALSDRGVKRTDRRTRCLILKKNLRSSNQVWK